MNGLLIQWGRVSLSSYTGDNLEINLPIQYTSSSSYAFIYGGIDYQFPTSTEETAKRIWTKIHNTTIDKIYISTTQRDVPRYKILDWITIGY